MSRTFALLDHKCPPLEKLLEEKKVSYEWFVCGCSPIERQYQILEKGEWTDINLCPFCGARMRSVHPLTPVRWIIEGGKETVVPWHPSLYRDKTKGGDTL